MKFMKAKEIASRLKNWLQDPDILAQVLLEMLDETLALIKQRKCRHDSSFVAVYREQNQKWRAICNLVPDLPSNLFEESVKTAMPTMYSALSKHRTFV
jgi:hypothetical protein